MVAMLASAFGAPETGKVLLLDDNTELAEAIEKYLSAQRFEVTVVDDGTGGLQAIMREDFDAIICDLCMPEIQGDEFYDAVEKVKPELCDRFIFITGFGRSTPLDTLGEKADKRILFKPFNLADLLTAILDLLSTGKPFPNKAKIQVLESDPTSA